MARAAPRAARRRPRASGGDAARGQRRGGGVEGRVRSRRGGAGAGGVGWSDARPRARSHGDPAHRRTRGRLAGLVPGLAPARRGARAEGPVDGNERRLRGGDRGGRDDGTGRHGDLRQENRRVSIKGKKVGFTGAGNMGEALIKGLVAANLVRPEAIYASDVRLERLKALDQQYG